MASLAIPLSTSARRLNQEARQAPTPTVEAAARLLGVVNEHPERSAFVARVLNALARLTDTAEPQSFTGTVSDYGALIRMLDRPEVLADLRLQDPLAPARLRGLRAREHLLSAHGGTCSGEELATILGVTRQAIDKRRRKGTLIGLSLGRRGYAYPVWQVDLDGLPAVLTELREYEPWTQAAFMLTSNSFLDGETPLAALQRGEVDEAVTAARFYGEQTAH
jgi:hypothetical protein